MDEAQNPNRARYHSQDIDFKTNYWMRSLGAHWVPNVPGKDEGDEWHLPEYPGSEVSLAVSQADAVTWYIAVHSRRRWWQFWKS